MNLDLAGKVAMVASSSKGIGRACAIALAEEGCRVSLCARGAEALAEARAALGSAASHASIVDVAKAEDLERWHRETVAALGGVDILVTNTGGPPVGGIREASEDAWRAGIESTLMNVVRLSRLVLPGMVERKWGRIVHLTSLVAKQPMPELTISSTLRAGLSGLTKTMSLELGSHGITVNAVLMGHVMTDRQKHLAEVRGKARGISEEQYFAELVQSVPVRRVGEPRDVGTFVAYLASPLAGYITGQSLAVDGGIIGSTF